MKYTIWTAPASDSCPALDQLDKNAPLIGHEEAKQRNEALRKKIEEGLKPFRRFRRR